MPVSVDGCSRRMLVAESTSPTTFVTCFWQKWMSVKHDSLSGALQRAAGSVLIAATLPT